MHQQYLEDAALQVFRQESAKANKKTTTRWLVWESNFRLSLWRS